MYFVVLYSQIPVRNIGADSAHSCNFLNDTIIEVLNVRLNGRYAFMEKKCFFGPQRFMADGFQGKNKRKKGRFCVPFFVDNKPVMGYTLLWRTNS